MEDQRFGVIVRMVRIRRRWRQQDLADRAGASRATVWRVEHGRLEEMSLATIRRIAEALEIRVELLARGRGSDLDRMVNARHSAMHESVARWLARAAPDWVVAHEVSFSVWGERGVVDVLAFHPGRRAMLIIEIKTELVDHGDLLATMDRRLRLAADIAATRGWSPATVSTWVVVARSRTTERRNAEHRSVLRSAFPDDMRAVRAWLAAPVGVVRALSLWRDPGTRSLAPVRRVRRQEGNPV